MPVHRFGGSCRLFGVVGAIWISFDVAPYSLSSRFGLATTSVSTLRSRPVCFHVSEKNSGGSFARLGVCGLGAGGCAPADPASAHADAMNARRLRRILLEPRD